MFFFLKSFCQKGKLTLTLSCLFEFLKRKCARKIGEEQLRSKIKHLSSVTAWNCHRVMAARNHVIIGRTTALAVKKEFILEKTLILDLFSILISAQARMHGYYYHHSSCFFFSFVNFCLWVLFYQPFPLPVPVVFSTFCSIFFTLFALVFFFLNQL